IFDAGAVSLLRITLLGTDAVPVRHDLVLILRLPPHPESRRTRPEAIRIGQSRPSFAGDPSGRRCLTPGSELSLSELSRALESAPLERELPTSAAASNSIPIDHSDRCSPPSDHLPLA